MILWKNLNKLSGQPNVMSYHCSSSHCTEKERGPSVHSANISGASPLGWAGLGKCWRQTQSQPCPLRAPSPQGETDPSPDNSLILRMSSPEHPSWSQGEVMGSRAWMADKVKRAPWYTVQSWYMFLGRLFMAWAEGNSRTSQVSPAPRLSCLPIWSVFGRSWLRTSMNSGH